MVVFFNFLAYPPSKAGLLICRGWRMSTAYGELLMPLAVALLESPVFPVYFLGYGSDSSSHTGPFSMCQSWEGGYGHSQRTEYTDRRLSQFSF